jgi:CheY-like chemotaxis protein
MMSPCRLANSPRLEALPNRPTPRRWQIRDAKQDPPPLEHPDRGQCAPSTPTRSPFPRDLVGLDVLVVDDDSGSLDYFAAALNLCGATVMTTSSALEGLRLMRERRPHVVLSDIAMVGQDGYWLVREIRGLADDAARAVPVVATTAYGREHSRERALAGGFNDFLPKPVAPELLCRTIAKAAGR